MTTPMQHVVPARFADAQMWVRNAIAAQAAASVRFRFTNDDNAPDGREGHWASPLQWIIRTAERVRDVEDVLRWLNTPLFLGMMVLLSGWAARRAGAFFFQAEDGIRDLTVTGVQTCALPI